MIKITVKTESGFETGDFSEWVLETQLGSATVILAPFKGDFAARFQTNPTLQEAYSRVAAPATTNHIFARGYFYLTKPLISDLGEHDRFNFIRIEPQDGWHLALAGIRREGANPPKWTLAYRGGHVFGSMVSDLLLDRWICVEVHYSKPARLVQLFVNDILETEFSPDTTDFPDPNMVKFGIEKSGVRGVPYDPTTEYAIDVLADECVIADSYIGMAPVTPPPSWLDGMIDWWNGLSQIQKALILSTSVGGVIIGGATVLKKPTV